MSVVATSNGASHNSSTSSKLAMDQKPFQLRSPTLANKHQPARERRRSLNVSHFNALQNAVSNLSRIDDFNLEELGYGFFSDVFKVTHKQTGNVMVLKRNKDTNTKMNILREVQLMNRLSHPNILKFKGVCVHEGQLHALTEFINGGDLDRLVTKPNVMLSWKQRVRLAHDVASGMKYLNSVGIFHRDLSAKNCLVRVTTSHRDKKKYSCVVADLGLAEKIPNTPAEEERLSIVGTPYIMAPEVLKGKPYNEKADVFSFGLLVCQLIALVSFDPEELPRTHDFGLARDLFQKLLSAPPTPGSSSSLLPPPDEFLQLAYDCCELNPKLRPSFNEIVSRLEKIIEKLKRKRVGRSSSVKGVAAETKNPSDQTAQNDMEESNSEDAQPVITEKKRSCSSSSSVRFSRSFSDISRELLSHAANMVASSSTDDVTNDDDNYSNPFATLKYEHTAARLKSNLRETVAWGAEFFLLDRVLKEVPLSSAAYCELFATSSRPHLNGGKMKLTDVPSLALLEMTFDLTTSENLKSSWKNQQTDYVRKKQRSKSVYSMDGNPNIAASPPPSPSMLQIPAPVLRLDRRGCRSVPQSPRGSASEDTLPPCQGCFYQRALNRAMILSPLGNNLASWWYSRHRFHKDTARHRRQSLAGVISLLSRNNQGVRRCISLPDLSRIASLFHAAEEADGKNSLQKIDSPRALRSRTSNDILYHRSSKEPILEESEAELLKLNSEKPDSMEEQLKTSSIPQQESSLSFEDTSPLDPNSVLFQDRCANPVDPYLTKNNFDEVKNRIDTPVSSSDSSGCSSSLSVTLHSGEVTRQKRRDNKTSSIPQTSHAEKHYFDSASTTNQKSLNRDSGYDDGVAEDQQHSAVSSPGCEVFHPLPWKIPEEVALVP